MRVLRAIVLGIWFVLCAAGQDAPRSAPFGGVWDTTYGAMTLTQDGDSVEGTYGSRGTLSGSVAEGRLTFRYRDPESRGEGWFELTSNGDVLRGRWRPESRERWREWAGTRIALEPPAPLSGVYQTHFGRLRLIVTGYLDCLLPVLRTVSFSVRLLLGGEDDPSRTVDDGPQTLFVKGASDVCCTAPLTAIPGDK